MSTIQNLNLVGQSLWYDNIQRSLIVNGELGKMIANGDIRGVTSNPSIFHNAIAKTHDYDTAIVPMAWAGWNAEKIFYQVAIEDIRAAADLFMPVFTETHGADGFVSLEVSPYLANDTQKTLSEAETLWTRVNRPNLMIKIPATPAGIPAIREAIARGINVNVTLIFSRERYAEVIEAYLTGLERRVAAGQPINNISSVASFFVSRVDTKVDGYLQEIVLQKGALAGQAASLQGKAAIANARMAYADFKAIFGGVRFAALKAKGAHVQRPLWASTGTKNPAYSDVIYIEELVGPDTVNTVPQSTLAAFRDHGRVRLSLGEHLEEQANVFRSLEAVGVSITQVTRELEAEGVKAFADAYTALLGTIDERRVNMRSELGSLQQSVTKRVEEFEKIELVKRLWDHDPNLWTLDPKGQEEIRKRMGWLDAVAASQAVLPEVNTFAKEVQGVFTHAVLLGMGGSSLAPEVTRQICGIGSHQGMPGLDLIILDSTDPVQVKATEDWAPIEKTLYIVSSKSGSTSEVNAFLSYFWSLASDKLGDEAGGHFVAITDPGTSLEKLAAERKFRHVFRADASVGGRNSALTAFGLVPAAVLGLDVEKLLERTGRLAAECAASVPIGRNPGVVLGAVLGEAALAGRDKVILLTDELWKPLGAWMEQLIAESSGKQGKGILPVDGEPLRNADWYSQDRLFVYLRSDGSRDELARNLRTKGHPVLTLTPQDAYDLGAEFFRWEIATAVACSVIGVNSFDQPDVQDSKDRTGRKIKEFKETRHLSEGETIWQKGLFQVFGAEFSGIEKTKAVGDLVRSFLAQAVTGDYIAINAYVPRNAERLAELQKLRGQIQELTGKPTTLGFGPRFLHSTGQLHKGGPDSGLFVQITAEPAFDFEIPGEMMSFGTLERAQSLGDLEALSVRGRRAIRVHLMKGAKLGDILP